MLCYNNFSFSIFFHSKCSLEKLQNGHLAPTIHLNCAQIYFKKFVDFLNKQIKYESIIIIKYLCGEEVNEWLTDSES